MSLKMNTFCFKKIDRLLEKFLAPEILALDEL